MNLKQKNKIVLYILSKFNCMMIEEAELFLYNILLHKNKLDKDKTRRISTKMFGLNQESFFWNNREQTKSIIIDYNKSSINREIIDDVFKYINYVLQGNKKSINDEKIILIKNYFKNMSIKNAEILLNHILSDNEEVKLNIFEKGNVRIYQNNMSKFIKINGEIFLRKRIIDEIKLLLEK